MTDPKEKKQMNSSSGYLIIAVGVIGVALRFIGGTSWTIISTVKFCISIAAIGVGLWTVLKKK